MGKVQNSSVINITRSTNNRDFENLGNKLFNGYVYSLGLDVGYNGNPTNLTLNIALNKTLSQVKKRSNVILDRKSDLKTIKSISAAKTNLPYSGNTGVSSNVGSPADISKIADNDFNIEEKYIGMNCSYNIVIKGDSATNSYSLSNFKITNFSIKKDTGQKILTLTLQDNTFVLSKIYVGILGQEIAIDDRSLKKAVIDKIQINCPESNGVPGGSVTRNNLNQYLHFVTKDFADQLNINKNNVEVKTDLSTTNDKVNYVILKSKDGNKTIKNGYGAVILLGEEDFKDSPCSSSEVLYTFKTLIAAMEALGITIYKNPPAAGAAVNSTTDYRSLQDKSKGRIKKSYHGTLRDVLNQWCDDYSYSYAVVFDDSKNFTIKGVDLASSIAKERVIQTKLELESLESGSSDFVIKSEDFSYDMGQKDLRLYSSYYSKDAKDKSLNFDRFLDNKSLYAIDLSEVFPQLFANTNSTGLDFCGTGRTYNQVVTSAVLGKYNPRLRQIYNYSIGAYQALGFTPINPNLASSQLNLLDNIDLNFQEAVTRAVEIQSELLYDSIDGKPQYDFMLGFFDESLASEVERIENYIADFIGRHYWSDPIQLSEGSIANEDFYAKYEINTDPVTQKVLVSQLYNLPIFQNGRFLMNEIQSLFNSRDKYFEAFSEFANLQYKTGLMCSQATPAYQSYINDATKVKLFRFYTERQGAVYGTHAELIKDISNFQYTIGANAELYNIDLADIYSPKFSQLSQVSIGVLQTAIPIDISNLPLGNKKFGMLAGLKKNIFNISPIGDAVNTNAIELQNSILNRCAALQVIFSNGNEKAVSRTKNSCNKTIFYTTCIQPAEDIAIQNNTSAQLLAAAGPDAYTCQRVLITRNMPSKEFILAHVNQSLVSSNGFLTLTSPETSTIKLQSICEVPGVGRSNVPYDYVLNPTLQFAEGITLPSQGSYLTKLLGKTTTETFLPFENYIRGGLEDAFDIDKILNNQGFAVNIAVNNITPNVRELFADQTTPSFITSSFINTQIANDTPFIMDYQGYLDGNPKYEFKTFAQFHSLLKEYYDEKSRSLLEPNVTYSADLFVSSISSSLKALLSVNNGLVKMNITLGESGLNVSCEFQSHPAAAAKLETLIYKNRPNIKFQNTNFLK